PPDQLAIGDAGVLRACELLKASYPLDADCIGTALGRARARDLKRQKHHVVAIESHARVSAREKGRLIVVNLRSIQPSRPSRLDFRARRKVDPEVIDARRLADVLGAFEDAREASGLTVLDILVEPSKRRKESEPMLAGSYKAVLLQTLFELARHGQRF